MLGQLVTIKGVWNLNQNAGAVTAQRIGAHSATMIEVLQDQQGLLDQRMAGSSLDVRNKADTARVVFVRTGIQPVPGCVINRDFQVLRTHPSSRKTIVTLLRRSNGFNPQIEYEGSAGAQSASIRFRSRL